MTGTRRAAAAALIVLAALMLLLIPFAFRYGAQPPAYLAAGAETAASEPLYLLRAQGDHLELICREGAPRVISAIDPRTLPPHDQAALAEGIALESDAALEELLQDYSS